MSGRLPAYTAPPFHGVAVGRVLKSDLPRGNVLVEICSLDGNVALECRVLQPYAGNSFGTFLIPEQGSEVLVACIHGDLRLPVVLGCLWNGQDTVPAERSGTKNPKLLKTRGGHQILLDDSQGAEKIEIVDSGGNNRIVIDTSGNSIEIKTDGKLRLKGGEITIEATGRLHLSGLAIDVDTKGLLNLTGSTINLN